MAASGFQHESGATFTAKQLVETTQQDVQRELGIIEQEWMALETKGYQTDGAKVFYNAMRELKRLGDGLMADMQEVAKVLGDSGNVLDEITQEEMRSAAQFAQQTDIRGHETAGQFNYTLTLNR